MKNLKNEHPLRDVWDLYPGVGKVKMEKLKKPPIERVIGEMFSMGEFYYYVLNLTNSTLSHHHEDILKIHGLQQYPENLKEITDLIHPDDIDFVMKAEQTVVEKILEIGMNHQLHLKSSYCFRMKTANNNYELFHHQAIHTLEDESKKLIQAINIHTNIHYITRQNPYTVLISGISPRTDFHQIKVENSSSVNQSSESLTKREKEILSFIAKGYSGMEISKMLIVSEHTVRTHRKNILRKTNSRNCKELLKKAFEWGLV